MAATRVLEMKVGEMMVPRGGRGCWGVMRVLGRQGQHGECVLWVVGKWGTVSLS
jgi:hypothetical protein